MVIRISKPPLRAALRSIQAGLLAGALFLLGYSGYVVAYRWNFQRVTLAELARPRTPAPPVVISTAGGHIAPLPARGALGRIDIPRLGIAVAILEGSSETVLRRAAGHITGTALPGQTGNSAISAHRDTFFRPLRNIHRDDAITITTPESVYRYRVLSTKIVKPTDLSVLDPGAGEILTLVTCYPFYFIGPAPRRFIVQAERVKDAAPQVGQQI